MKIVLRVTAQVTAGTMETEASIKAAISEALEAAVSGSGFAYGKARFTVNSFTID